MIVNLNKVYGGIPFRCGMSKNNVTVSSKIPLNLRLAMRKFIEMDTHVNESDFIRAAIREKIKAEAPQLIEELFIEEE